MISKPTTILATALASVMMPGLSAQAGLTAYPDTPGGHPSPHYSIRVVQGATVIQPAVYRTLAQWRTNRSTDASWASFAFTGRATVTVTRLNRPFTTCQVLPSSRGIVPTVESDRVTFELDRPGQFSIEFDRSIEHPLMIFADPPETDVPDPADPSVIRFEAGIHDLGPDPLPVKSGQTVYLAPGAFLLGRIHGIGASDARICGRGVLWGEHLAAMDAEGNRTGHLVFFDRASDRVTVEGITMIASPHYNLLIRGNDAVVRNVKMMGWWFGNDGIGTGPNSLIEDCFLRVNDDAFKLYHSNTTIRRCVVWQMENGAAFQFTWNMPTDNAGFRVSDCDVIRVDHHQDANNRGIFTAIHGGSGNMSDYLFDDVRIENATFRLVLLTALKTSWARSPYSGNITDVTFRNISADGPFSQPSVIRSYESTGRFEGITFENLRIGGKWIHSAEEGAFEIDPASTADIRFIVTRQKP